MRGWCCDNLLLNKNMMMMMMMLLITGWNYIRDNIETTHVNNYHHSSACCRECHTKTVQSTNTTYNCTQLAAIIQ